MPISFKAGIYTPGLPAPVVITGTRSSTTTSITSFTKGDINIILQPNGLLVRSLTLRISLRKISGGICPAPIMPRPPASDTADASSAVPNQAIPP